MTVHSRSRRRALAAVVAALALVATACGGSSKSSSGSGGTGSSSSSGGGATVRGPAGLSMPAMKQGGSLTVLEVGTEMGEWATGLDPGTSDTPATNMDMENAIFGSLFELAGKNGTLVPDLATGYKISPDGKTVDIYIRKGVKFSDGTPFNAQAVVYNWNRDFQLKDNDLPLWPIAASNPFTATDPYTVEIHLAKPYSPIINTIHIHDVNWIVSPTALAKMGEQAFKLKPVGAGPFTVVSDTVSSELVLKRNPLYWQKGLPYLDNLTFKSVSSDESALETMQAGQAQAYLGMGTLKLVPSFKSSFTVTSQETADPYDVQFNTTKPPFNNKLAREAVYYATDAATLDRTLNENTTPVVEGFTAPGGLFYHQNVPGYRTYNLAKAKAIVKQLGGLSFDLLGSAAPTTKALDEALQTMWQQAGMKVNLVISPDLQSRIQTFKQNNWQVSPGGDGSYDPAGGVGVWFWFLSTSPYTGVHDPQIDALIENATTVPEDQRDAAYQKLAKYISDNALAVQLYPASLWDIADHNVYGPCMTTVCPETEAMPETLWEYAGYKK